MSWSSTRDLNLLFASSLTFLEIIRFDFVILWISSLIPLLILISLNVLNLICLFYLYLFLSLIYIWAAALIIKFYPLPFGIEYNQPLRYGFFPSSLTHLTFGDDFYNNVEDDEQSFSSCLSSFFTKKRVPRQSYLPPNLTHLTFGDSFNKSVDLLPPSLKYLTFGKMFELPINHLPSSIIEIIIPSKRFNQSLAKLPSSLLRLHIKNDKCLPLPPRLCHMHVIIH